MSDRAWDEMTEEELVQLAEWFNTYGIEEQPGRLNGLLDIHCTAYDPETMEVSYRFRPKEMFLNPYGEVHGGAVASVYDTAAGMGAVALTKTFTTTVNLNVTYLRPMRGESFRVVIRYDHIGHRIINTTGKIIDPVSGKVCSTCAATYYRTGIMPKEFLRPAEEGQLSESMRKKIRDSLEDKYGNIEKGHPGENR